MYTPKVTMKICPNCKTENGDQTVYCITCRKVLPKLSHMENLISNGIYHLERGEYEKAKELFSEVNRLEIANKRAWFLRGVTLLYLRRGKDARDAFTTGGISTTGVPCSYCGRTGRCGVCGQTGKCYQCKGEGTCASCGGGGTCQRCDDTGKCYACGGEGVCSSCKGDRICFFCGGTGKYLKLDLTTVPKDLRKFVVA